MHKNQKYRLVNLDGLRGWAAVFVAMMHFPLDGVTHQLPLIKNGFLFVDLFFVLSGVVISYVYLGNFDRKKFFIARFARLGPIYFATLMLAVILEIIKVVGIGGFDGGFREPNSLDGLFREFFLIHTFPMFSNTSFNPPNWSVAVEAYAYVLFALLSIFTFKRSFFVWVLFSVISFCLIFKAGVLNDAHNLAIPRGILGFSLGVISFNLWHFYLKDTELKYLGDLGLLLIFLYIWWGGSSLFPPALAMTIGVTMMLAGANRMHFSILMENRLAVQLGKYSFAIYMIHYFIAMRFDEIYRYLPSSSVVEIALFFVYCSTTWLVAGLVYKHFEWPLRNYIRDRWQN